MEAEKKVVAEVRAECEAAMMTAVTTVEVASAKALAQVKAEVAEKLEAAKAEAERSKVTAVRQLEIIVVCSLLRNSHV